MNTHSNSKIFGKVAVITRTKNRNILLPRSINSVLSQTSPEWVHVIINDGGDTEELESTILPFRENYGDRLIVIHNEFSLGMEAASNKAIMAVDSDYIVIHDDDDSWQETFLEETIAVLENNQFPSVKGVVTHSFQIYETISSQGAKELNRREFTPNLSAVSIPDISEVNRFMPIAFIYNRSVLEKTGLYDETLPVIGDWDFNIRFFLHYDVVVLKKCLANYHVRENTSSEYSNSIIGGQDKHNFYRALIINKHIRAGVLNSQDYLLKTMMFGDYFYRLHKELNGLSRFLYAVKQNALVMFLWRKLGRK